MMRNPIVEAIGKENFHWLSRTFSADTGLPEVPGAILERIAAVDITVRDYARDKNSITAIALITFAYEIAGKGQTAQSGPKDIRLLKALARGELARRRGEPASGNRMWDAPLVEIITGDVGRRVRAMRTIDTPA